MPVTPNGIGELLRESRERAGLSREEQADAVGDATGEWCSPDTVKNWEAEKRIPRRPSLQGIADAYGLPMD
ncbi:helix-turn-helix domain-containing protein [Kitasatospora aureofaciens]|uniref:helix-turn-helix domain-containing protein n=1 Tax=Kitasatospora aureofaciens TaxID=1894 RepID=UPI0027E1DA38|nr:helix-turn-helix transcriptional regulator [Kitasatospora aureofaciens]